MWEPAQAVDILGGLIEKYPPIEDIHFWTQLPGEPVSAGDRQIDAIASKVLPNLRA